MYSVNNYILLIQVFSVLSRWICLKLLIVYFSCVFDRFDKYMYCRVTLVAETGLWQLPAFSTWFLSTIRSCVCLDTLGMLATTNQGFDRLLTKKTKLWAKGKKKARKSLRLRRLLIIRIYLWSMVSKALLCNLWCSYLFDLLCFYNLYLKFKKHFSGINKRFPVKNRKITSLLTHRNSKVNL